MAIGHSFAAGWCRGWSSSSTTAVGAVDAFWAVDFAPWFAMKVGDGPIAGSRPPSFAMVSYEYDYFVDTRTAIEIFGALDLPGAPNASTWWSTRISSHQPAARGRPSGTGERGAGAGPGHDLHRQPRSVGHLPGGGHDRRLCPTGSLL